MEKLLHRLGEGPADLSVYESSKSPTAPTSPGPGDKTYKDSESSAAPIMVIRDLATDMGAESLPDTKSLETVLEDLISPDLALNLLTMYEERDETQGISKVPTDFILVSLNIMVDGCCLTPTAMFLSSYPT